MATIVNTLQLKNPMVTSLQDLNKYANVTAHHLEDLSPKFKNAFDVHIFDKAKKSMEVTGEVVNTVSKEIDKAEGKQSEFNEAVKQGEQQASGLKKAIIGLAKDGYKLVTGFMSESLDLANQQVAAEQRLHSIMSKVGGTTQEQVDQMKLLAAEMQGGTTIADQVGMTGMAELGSFNIGAESIQALTPALYDLAVAMHGVEVSQEEMMKTSKLVGEVMGGKVGEISKLGVSFNEAQMEILKTGSEAERAALLVDVLGQSFGGLAQDMAQTPQGVALQLANEWNNFKEVIGYGLVPVMLEFIETIQAHMPTIQEVFLTVFDTIIQLLGSILEYSSMVVDFFTNYWSIIEPVIWGIVAALTAYLLITQSATILTSILAMKTNILAMAQALYNAILSVNPLVLIIAVVVGLIVALARLWQRNNAVAASFYENWNGILNFFSTLPAFFYSLAQVLLMPIYIWAMKTGKIIDFVINKFIDGFNKVVELYNKVTGLSIDLVPEFSVGEFAKDVMGYLQTKKEEVYANAAQKAAERQARFSKPELPPIGTGTGRESGFGTGLETKGLGNIDTINKVGEVGQIRDSVDISSEDLKMMRELAEIKNVQNFVSLTPTVSVQTGDINQGYDIETIVSNITEKLETQIVSSARAVYDI